MAWRIISWVAPIAVALLAWPAAADDAPVLTTERYDGPGVTPAFVGNGYLGARIPFDGQGYSEKPIPTLSAVQGLFGVGRFLPWGPKVERRASLPAWSSLDYDDGSGRFALDKGVVRHYRQSLDLRHGALTTEIDWVSPGGRQVLLRYDVLPDRARPQAAVVRLRFVPGFAGPVSVIDPLDPATGRFVKPLHAGHDGGADYVDLATDLKGVAATLASELTAKDGPAVSVTAPQGGAAQKLTFDVSAGHTYEIVKTVGVAVSTDGDSQSPHDRAIEAAATEARLGYDEAKRDSDAAWDALWAAYIQIDGDPALQRAVRAAQFALFASARDDLPWAPSPTGLSSDGYMGHIFWDSETWMFPVYLATAPDIAKQLLEYRLGRLAGAQEFARQTGARGVRFPWESALGGGETVPLAGYGHEIHIVGDIALAAWQYWLATGDEKWLERAFPMLVGIADFWVSRASANPDGSRSIRDVVPPDENVLLRNRFGMFGVLAGGGALVDDSIYTNETARRALFIAAEAAQALSRVPNPAWVETARMLRTLPAGETGVRPEFAGYDGGSVKQADVVVLSYPWEETPSAAATQAELDYYAPRTDPNGPTMTDAIHSIVASQIGAPGCAAYSFTRRSVDPFMRPPYSQFGETRTGGVVTFVTGAGGFLQEFIYGYAGLRWRADALWLDPSLPPQLHGITLSALHWRGRTVRVEVRPQRTLVTLLAGDTMRVDWPGGSAMLAADAAVTVRTRLPASGTGGNLALCRPVTDSAPGPEPALTANDGSDATTWIAAEPGHSLTIDLEREVALDTVTVTRPPVLAVVGKSLLGPAFARPVLIHPEQTASEDVEISTDAKSWSSLGKVEAPGVRDLLQAGGRKARYLRLSAPDATADRPLVIGDVAATEAVPRTSP